MIPIRVPFVLREWYLSADFYLSLRDSKKRPICFSWLMENLSKLLPGSSTLRNLLWSLNIDSIILFYILLSTTTTQLLLSDVYRIRKAGLVLRFLAKSKLCNVIPSFYVFVLAVKAFQSNLLNEEIRCKKSVVRKKIFIMPFR